MSRRVGAYAHRARLIDCVARRDACARPLEIVKTSAISQVLDLAYVWPVDHGKQTIYTGT